MAFSISPTTGAPGAAITATGKTAKRRDYRIVIEDITVATGRTNSGGSFTTTFKVPSGVDRVVDVILRYQRTDGVWAQTASVKLTIKNTVTPPPPPPPTGPIISDVQATDITQTSAKIRWTLNEPATGQVQYGQTTVYGQLTPKETSFNYSAHIQNITGLTAGTLYHFRVVSTNQAGGTTTSGDNTFTTLGNTPPPPQLPPAPSNLTALAGDKNVKLAWGA
jgi:hypothetical protein